MNSKVCTKCNTNKRFDEFHKRPSTTVGITAWCKLCYNAYCRAYRNKNKEKIAKYKKIYNKINPEIQRRLHLKHNYNLTLDEYNAMLKHQDHKCAICHSNNDGKTLHIDHCHKNGQVRGLLCQKCNNGIGHFRDNIQLLFAAAGYLLYDFDEHRDKMFERIRNEPQYQRLKK